MHLTRPLVFLDLETTGLDIDRDRIIEIAFLRIEGPRLALEGARSFHSFVDPEQPLPPSITELTHITELHVSGAPTFRELAPELEPWLADADLAGYNLIGFDVPVLRKEFERVGRSLPGPPDRVLVDALEIWRMMEPRNLRNAYRYFVGRELDEHHRALDDVWATAEVLQAQVQRYGLHASPSETIRRLRHPYLDSKKRFKKEGDEIILCFGKYRGYTLRQVEESDPDYLMWLMDRLDEDVRRLLKR